MAHLRAVPDPDDDPVLGPGIDPDIDRVVEPVDPAAAVAPESAPESEPESEYAPSHLAEPAPDDQPRRYPSTIGGAFYLSILGVAVTALVIATRTDWRLGIQILGGALLVAALIRLVLATRDAGMLAVRNRFVDAFLLGGAGAALLALASSIPNQPVG